ncbi:MAG: hypothetical protein MUE65_05275, partial [Methanomassiliicoccales archaeon]|nr:hypothetical protein [Methanomassiliicoccales archaeon]
GAQVVNENGQTIVNQVPIPVLTAFGQSLFALLEFDDVGYDVPILGNYGSGNGLFDFSGPTLWSGVGSFEPVYKYVDLSRAWTLSEIETMKDESSDTVYYTFSLNAQNVTYAKVWDPALMQYRNGTEEDGVLENLEFRFHIEASAEVVTKAVPFYKVTIADGHVTDSEEIAPRNFTATNVQCGIKYDHIIEGWDAYEGAQDPKLMLENLVIFGMFVPEIVEEWYNAQFVQDNIQNGDGSLEYTTDGARNVVKDQDDLPRQSVQVMSNTAITSQDNWERCGELTWVSNVTVDGEEQQMRYQVHVGDEADLLLGQDLDGHDGHLKLLVVLGGYIYPMGADVMHDPSVFAEALQMSDDALKTVVLVLFVGVVVVCIGLLIALLLIRRLNKREQDKFNYRSPPGYRP